jgi:hypothetical protein
LIQELQVLILLRIKLVGGFWENGLMSGNYTLRNERDGAVKTQQLLLQLIISN